MYGPYHTPFKLISSVLCHCEDLLSQLQMLVSNVPDHDFLLLSGDMNAKVGTNNSNNERAMGKHGCGERNNNGVPWFFHYQRLKENFTGGDMNLY